MRNLGKAMALVLPCGELVWLIMIMRTAILTDDKMHRYFLFFDVEESLDPAILRVMVFYLADLAQVVLSIYAHSPWSFQFAGTIPVR